MGISLTTETFIRKARLIWGDRYDYSLINYINYDTKVKIICKIHGVFEQVPDSHLSKHGCYACSYMNRGMMTLEKFVQRANKKHNNFYTYTNSIYNGTEVKLLITCPIHGDFPQMPSNHLAGTGCPECGKIRTGLKSRSNTEEFIKKVKLIFPNEGYDYSLTDYTTTDTPVKVICPKHGIFEQRPNNHLNGRGCQKCSAELMAIIAAENSSGWSYLDWIKSAEKSKHFDSYKVYIIRCWNETEEFYKIGRTFCTVKKRFDHNKIMPYNYEVLKIIESEDAKHICELEKQLQKENKKFKYFPNIKFTGMYECFSNACRTSCGL